LPFREGRRREEKEEVRDKERGGERRCDGRGGRGLKKLGIQAFRVLRFINGGKIRLTGQNNVWTRTTSQQTV